MFVQFTNTNDSYEERREGSDENHADWSKLRSVPRDKWRRPFDVFPFRDTYLRLAEIYWKSFYYRDSSLIDWHELLGNFYPLILPSNESRGVRSEGKNPYSASFSKRSFLDEILSENAYSTRSERRNCFTMGLLFPSWIFSYCFDVYLLSFFSFP